MEPFPIALPQAFGPEEINILTAALDRVCAAIAHTERKAVSAEIREMLAGFILNRAMHGERDESNLVDAAIVRYRL